MDEAIPAMTAWVSGLKFVTSISCPVACSVGYMDIIGHFCIICKYLRHFFLKNFWRESVGIVVCEFPASKLAHFPDQEADHATIRKMVVVLGVQRV